MAPSILSSSSSSSSSNLAARAIPVQGAVATNSLSPITIVGVVIAGLLGAGAALWVGIRWFRKRQSRSRDDKRASAFLNVRGVSKDGEEPKNAAPGYVFSFVCAMPEPIFGSCTNFQTRSSLLSRHVVIFLSYSYTHKALN